MSTWEKVTTLCSKYNEKINFLGIEDTLDNQCRNSEYSDFLHNFEEKIAPELWSCLNASIKARDFSSAISTTASIRARVDECAQKLNSDEAYRAASLIADFCGDLQSLLREEMAV